MRLVSLEELDKMPNGTVYSEIHDVICQGDIDNIYDVELRIDGLNVLYDDGIIKNGILHMFNYITLQKDLNWDETLEEYNSKHDYNCPMSVVYDKTDIIDLINVLLWALNECKGELLISSEDQYSVIL